MAMCLIPVLEPLKTKSSNDHSWQILGGAEQCRHLTWRNRELQGQSRVRKKCVLVEETVAGGRLLQPECGKVGVLARG